MAKRRYVHTYESYVASLNEEDRRVGGSFQADIDNMIREFEDYDDTATISELSRRLTDDWKGGFKTDLLELTTFADEYNADPDDQHPFWDALLTICDKIEGRQYLDEFPEQYNRAGKGPGQTSATGTLLATLVSEISRRENPDYGDRHDKENYD